MKCNPIKKYIYNAENKFEIWVLKTTILDPQKSPFLVFEEKPPKFFFSCFRPDSALKTIDAQMFFCLTSCFAFIFFKQTDEFNYPSCWASCFASVFLKQTDEFNHLFQKDWGKTTSVARILSPNLTRRPSPCLLIQSFFYAFIRLESYVCFLLSDLPRKWNNFDNQDIKNVGSRAQFKKKCWTFCCLVECIVWDIGFCARHVNSNFSYINCSYISI